jgi:hypothetical protein
MSGLVLLLAGRPLKPALKISGENRRRFYFEPICGRERGNAERESAGEILSEAKDLLHERGNAEREPRAEILSERSEPKDLFL